MFLLAIVYCITYFDFKKINIQKLMIIIEVGDVWVI
jgi:hypothetical protein